MELRRREKAAKAAAAQAEKNRAQAVALEAARQINKNLKREHPLHQLFWECTLRCNVHCRHCGSDCRHEPTKPDMPRDDFFRVLDRVAERYDPAEVFVIVSAVIHGAW